MDFSVAETPELRAFRQETKSWIEGNMPKGLPADPRRQSRRHFEELREFQRKIGKKGWRLPFLPKEYGGAGLNVEKAAIIEEELSLSDLGPFSLDDNGPSVVTPAVMTYGTEEQKKKIMLPIARGEVVTWQGLTEPEAGSDLASLKTTAIRDGDSYVINGTKIFQGGPFGPPEWFYIVAITNPDRPRHHNLGVFTFPVKGLPGFSTSPMHLIGVDRNACYFDNFRVPAEYLIGKEGQGWQVSQAQLEIEHGFGGISVDRTAPLTLQFLREGPTGGKPFAGDPITQDMYAEVYIGVNANRLFQLRNFSQRLNQQFGTYEGSQNALHSKTFRQLRQGELNLKMCGLYALMDDEKEAPVQGLIEQHQRESIATHPIGTIEIQKVIMSRRMAMSATQERAAATV